MKSYKLNIFFKHLSIERINLLYIQDDNNTVFHGIFIDIITYRDL